MPDVPGPHDIVFTQYLRPHGRAVRVWVERAPAVAETAAKLRAAGFHFDIEELQDGTVSMTVEPNTPRREDGPIAIELCPNGPAVLAAVDRLIERAATVALRGRRGRPV